VDADVRVGVAVGDREEAGIEAVEAARPALQRDHHHLDRRGPGLDGLDRRECQGLARAAASGRV
jgi:hypothetical protein